ncbi:MAG TPA: septum formation initiator family protein, partial [Vicinamibacterales bacterium]|nr:septum formation initiator family protein [Vicinamibacterales bacterium]
TAAGVELPPPVLPRRREQQRRRLRIGLTFVTAAVALNALVGERGVVEAWRLRRARAALAAELDRTRAENAALRDEIRRLRDDPAAIEALARERLGLIKPGEILVVVGRRVAPPPAH